MSRLPHFLDNGLTDGGEVVCPMRRPAFTVSAFTGFRCSDAASLLVRPLAVTLAHKGLQACWITLVTTTRFEPMCVILSTSYDAITPFKRRNLFRPNVIISEPSLEDRRFEIWTHTAVVLADFFVLSISLCRRMLWYCLITGVQRASWLDVDSHESWRHRTEHSRSSYHTWGRNMDWVTAQVITEWMGFILPGDISGCR
jgi:hypothetical protein